MPTEEIDASRPETGYRLSTWCNWRTNHWGTHGSKHATDSTHIRPLWQMGPTYGKLSKPNNTQSTLHVSSQQTKRSSHAIQNHSTSMPDRNTQNSGCNMEVQSKPTFFWTQLHLTNTNTIHNTTTQSRNYESFCDPYQKCN